MKITFEIDNLIKAVEYFDSKTIICDIVKSLRDVKGWRIPRPAMGQVELSRSDFAHELVQELKSRVEEYDDIWGDDNGDVCIDLGPLPEGVEVGSLYTIILKVEELGITVEIERWIDCDDEHAMVDLSIYYYGTGINYVG